MCHLVCGLIWFDSCFIQICVVNESNEFVILFNQLMGVVVVGLRLCVNMHIWLL